MAQWLVVLALAGVAASDDQQQVAAPPTFDEEVVVTAALESETRSALPVSATVIDRAEIRDRQATQVIDVLRTVPGLDVAQSGSPGKVTSLFSRGTESDQTLVLWNGLPLNDPFFGGFDWAFLPTDGVGRVEVVRGPFSSLYGSEAMGGVVQVLSDRSSGGSARLEGGSDSYGRLGAAWGEDFGTVRFDLAGHSRSGDGAAENDFYDSQDLMGRLEWKASGDATLGLLVRKADAEIGIPMASGSPSPRRRQDSDSLQLAVPLVIDLERWKIEALLSRTETDFLFSDVDAIFSLNATETERVRARSVATYRAGEGFWIAAGAEWKEDEVSNVSNFGPTLDGSTRQDWALFGQLSREIGRFRFDAGLRHDTDEFYGGRTSPRLGAVVDLAPGWQFFASYGEGFRAPSLGELFFPFFGNTELEPEESRSIEAGVRFASAPWWAGLAYFDNELENLIESDPVTFTATNVGRAETSGWEIEAGYRQALWEVRGQITLLEATNLDIHEPLLRRAEEKASLLAVVRPENFILQFTGRWVGERIDLDPVTFERKANEDFLVADLAVTWNAGERWSPYGRIGNLADKEYEEVLGFPALGRTWVLGLEVGWR